MAEGKKETVYFFILNLISKGLYYILLLIFANYFIPDIYGKASFVVSVFHIILLFTLLGLPFAMVSWWIKKRDSSSIFYFLLLLTVLTMIIGFILTKNSPWIWPLLWCLPFLLVTHFCLTIFRAKHQYHFFQGYNTLTVLILIILVYLLRSQGAVGIIKAYSWMYISLSIPCVIIARKEIFEIIRHIKFKFISIKHYIIKGLVSSLLVSSFSLLLWIDSTILGWLSTFENVAKYSIAGSITNSINIFALSISIFLLTRSAQVEDTLISRQILNRSIRLAIFFSIVAAILLNSYLPLLMKLFFNNYIGIEIYVMLLSIGIIFYGIYALQYSHLTGVLKPEIALWPICFAAAINVILDIILIPSFSIYGICIATIIAHLSALIWLSVKMQMFKQILPAIFLVLFLPAAYILQYWGGFLVIFAIYLMFQFNIIKKEDILIVKQIFISIIKR